MLSLFLSSLYLAISCCVVNILLMIPLKEGVETLPSRNMKVCNHCRRTKAISHFVNKRRTGLCVLCDKCRQAQEMYTRRKLSMNPLIPRKAAESEKRVQCHKGNDGVEE